MGGRDKIKSYSSMEPPTQNGQDAINAQTSSLITVDDAIERIGYGKYQMLVTLAVGLGFVTDAMEILLLSFLSVVLESLWGLSSKEASLMTGIVFLGAMTGTLVLGRLGDIMGRRPIFLFSVVLIATFGLVTAVCNSFSALVLVRFIVGFGVGGLTIPFDILAELLPMGSRGQDLLFIEYFWTIGAVVVPLFAMVTIGSGESNDENGWRCFVVLCAIPCILSLVSGICLVPESPRWLLTKGRGEEALNILRKAARTNGLDPYSVFPEGISLREEEPETARICDLFTTSWRWITVNLWVTWGGFAVLYYGIVIATTAFFSDTSDGQENDSYNFDYAAIFTSGLAEGVGTTLAIFLIDRVGRVILQGATYFLGGLCILLLCIFSTHDPQLHNSMVALAFFSRLFIMAACSATWVHTAEILPTEIRSTGHSAANAVARIGGFAAPFLVQDSNNHVIIGFIMFLTSCLATFAIARLPETKGKTLGVHLNHAQASNDKSDLMSYEFT